MPTITVEDRRAEVAHGTRLVLAIEALGIDIGHRCGGKARCTTCRVTFVRGEPDLYTRAEYRKLEDVGLLGQARLSCQMPVEHDMELRVLKTLQTEGWTDTGPAVGAEIVPEAQRLPREELAQEARLA